MYTSFLHRYTIQKGYPDTVYALVLKWPKGQLHLGAPVPTSGTLVTLLGYAEPFKWSVSGGSGMIIDIPPLSVTEVPCLWAWVFKLTHVL